jgi:hypothetical protein
MEESPFSKQSFAGESGLPEVTGELKRTKSFWSSSKNYYKLKYPHMLIGKIKKGVVEYSIKYDLSLYTVSLSTKDKAIFYLTPINLALKLSRLEFSAKNAEERAKWYVALTKCMKVNKFDNM